MGNRTLKVAIVVGVSPERFASNLEEFLNSLEDNSENPNIKKTYLSHSIEARDIPSKLETEYTAFIVYSIEVL